MTQIATVEKILPGGFVEISVPRKSACGHDCEECAGCGMTGAAIHARAKDPVGVRPGQKVVVESATRKILGVVALVYLLPVVGFLLGYFLSEGLAEGVRYAIAIGAAAFPALAIAARCIPSGAAPAGKKTRRWMRRRTLASS